MQNNSLPVSLRRILITLLVSLVLAIFLYKIWDSDYVYAHRKYFTSDDIIYLNFNKLESLSVKEAKKNFPINWWCGSNNSLPDFGNYFCADELKGWDNVPAMLVVFWFKNGKLNNAKIDIPYWHNTQVIQKIRKEYGEPIQKSHRRSYLNTAIKLGLNLAIIGKYTKINKIKIDDLGIWELKSGAWIVTAINPGINPFSWNTIFWINPRDVQKIKNSLISAAT